jgi:RHH-type proline utilization regulon transcriptional repressor/proline dehydrogenase/delta 1-pyrroline-5-carboxylate dehydrogenase
MFGTASTTAHAYLDWLRSERSTPEAECCANYTSRSALGTKIELRGPVGERNVYMLRARGAVAALARTRKGLLVQIGVILATGNRAFVEAANPARVALKSLPTGIASQICLVEDWHVIDNLKAVLFEGEGDALIAINRDVAQRDGPILPVLSAISAADDYDLNLLLEEVSISTNTAAAGGNASLMSIG